MSTSGYDIEGPPQRARNRHPPGRVRRQGHPAAVEAARGALRGTGRVRRRTGCQPTGPSSRWHGAIDRVGERAPALSRQLTRELLPKLVSPLLGLVDGLSARVVTARRFFCIAPFKGCVCNFMAEEAAVVAVVISGIDGELLVGVEETQHAAPISLCRSRMPQACPVIYDIPQLGDDFSVQSCCERHVSSMLRPR